MAAAGAGAGSEGGEIKIGTINVEMGSRWNITGGGLMRIGTQSRFKQLAGIRVLRE